MTKLAAELLAIATEIVALEERLKLRTREFHEVARRGYAGRVKPREVIQLHEEQNLRVPLPPPREGTLRGFVLGCFNPGVEVVAGDIVHVVQSMRREGRVQVKTEVIHTMLSKLAAEGILVRVRFGVYRLNDGSQAGSGRDRDADPGA